MKTLELFKLNFDEPEAPAPTKDVRVVKAISVRQPWAWLLLHGKDVENRSKPTNYRGAIYIHASKTFDWDGFAWLWENKREYAIKTVEHFGIIPLREPDLKATKGEFGGIIGAANLVDCVTSSASPCSSDLMATSWRGQSNSRSMPVPASSESSTWRSTTNLSERATEMPQLECYGRRFGALDACASCEWGEWCQGAGDLPSGSQRELHDEMMAQLESIPVDGETILAEDDAEAERPEGDESMAQALKDAFVAIARLADGNDTRLGILFDRIAGISYEEIARKRGMTKQGVEKHLRSIRDENPSLYDYLVKTAVHLPIKAVETGSQLGLVDSDRKAVRKGYTKKARPSQDDGVSMLL